MNTIVAIPFDEDLGSFIGKKGSENSMTFYNRKLGEHVIVGLMPTSIEEKFYALPQSLLMADQILVSTRSIDRLFGEVLIACALLGKRTMFTKDGDISKLLSGMNLENFSFVDREGLLDAITSFKQEPAQSDSRVDIDRAFNVKGVGTVVLGVVTKGTIKVHDTLYHNSGKTITVRSIQSQDEDIKEAPRGTRVGLAVKGLDESEMQKGDILSARHIKSARSLELDVMKSGFVSEQMERGKVYQLAIGFSYVNATVEGMQGSSVSVKLEKGIPAEVGDSFMLARAVAPRIFASGKVAKRE